MISCNSIAVCGSSVAFCCHRYVCMYVCIRGGLLQPLHLDPQWSILLNPMIDEDDFWRIGGMKTTPAPLCPPQNPTWQTRSRTPNRSGGKPATNRLSYGAAFLAPFRRLLRLAGSRWRYSIPLPHGFDTGVDFLRVLRFPLRILIPPTAPHSSHPGLVQ
jgi:hypothetical protein